MIQRLCCSGIPVDIFCFLLHMYVMLQTLAVERYFSAFISINWNSPCMFTWRNYQFIYEKSNPANKEKQTLWMQQEIWLWSLRQEKLKNFEKWNNKRNDNLKGSEVSIFEFPPRHIWGIFISKNMQLPPCKTIHSIVRKLYAKTTKTTSSFYKYYRLRWLVNFKKILQRCLKWKKIFLLPHV